MDFYHNIFSLFGFRREYLSPAGRMIARLDDANASVKTESDITDELRAALRRCEVRSRWANWDQKAPGAQS